MCGRFAVTTDPALLAEKIKAIDEATAADGHRTTGAELRRQLQRRADHDRSAPWSNGTPSPTTSRPGGCGSMRWGLVPPWVKTSRRRRPGHQGPAADQRPRRQGHHLAGVPQLGQEQALPGADGRLVRVATATAEGRQDAVLHVRRRRRAAVHGRAVVDVAAEGRGQGRRAAAELHHHHHRCGRPARRHPRPDAADHQRARLGPLAGPGRPDRRGAAARPRRPRPDRDPRGVRAW